jgi:hypothetical protein
MPRSRTTNPQCLWLTLLVAFALNATGGVPWARDTQATGGELELKTAVLEPDIYDDPSIGPLNHGNHPILRIDRRFPGPGVRLARHEADRITLIRGPPAGCLAPA